MNLPRPLACLWTKAFGHWRAVRCGYWAAGLSQDLAVSPEYEGLSRRASWHRHSTLLHRHRPLHRGGSLRRKGLAGQEDAAGVDAVLQARELLHGERGFAQGGARRPHRKRVRLPDPGSSAASGDRGEEAAGEWGAEGDHYHSIANPAKGEPVGERGLPNQGYRPGRKTARRQDKKRKRKGGGS